MAARTDQAQASMDFIADHEPLPETTPHLGRDALLIVNVLIEMCRRLRVLDRQLIQGTYEQRFDGVVGQCAHLVKSIDGWGSKPPMQNAVQLLQEQITKVYQQANETFAVPLALAALHRGTPELVADLERMRDRAEKILGEIQTAASKSAVAVHAAIFADEAENHAMRKQGWFWGAVGIAVLILAFGVFLFGIYLSDQGPKAGAQAVQTAVASLAMLSVLYFGMLWCVRTYRAHEHNETVNRHRANSLRTFAAFVEGASSDQVRDAVLVQASQCIFSPQVTGFAPGQESDSPATPQIFEIFRGIGQSAIK